MSKVKKCVGKESLQRMNYLYQLSNIQTSNNENQKCLSNQYSNLMINISKKAVQRLEPDIKRTICKGCRSLLVPGINCKVRIRKKEIRVHCLSCHTVKTFKTKRNFKLWPEQPEAIIEVLNYAS